MTRQVVKTDLDGSVLVIQLSAPESRNSLTQEMRDQIGEAVRMAAGDRQVRCVFLTAEGRSFCSGGDLSMLKTANDPWSVHRRFRDLNRWLLPLITLDKPVVVGVNGHAVGGGMGLALAGDVVIAAERATFIPGFFRLGVIPDIGVMYHLPRLIGMAQAKNLLFSGAELTAARAAELGLVYRVVPDSDLYAAGIDEAKRLAAGPAQVIGLAKTLMARSFETTLGDMFAFEGFGQVLAMASTESREGIAAMLEKRPADFTGSSQAVTQSTIKGSRT